MLDNSQIRKQIKQKRLHLSKEDYLSMSLSCFELLKQELNKHAYTTIGIYLPIQNEIDTTPLIHYLWNLGKEVYIPKCEEKGMMNFYKMNSFMDVSKGEYGILEPITNIQNNQLDLMVVPIVGINQEGYRLGNGGGYYDRFLDKYPTYTIAIGFSFQETKFSVQTHDKQLNQFITEKEITYF